MKSKEEITQVIFDNLPEINPWKDLSIDKLYTKWWITGRSSQGLRLSDEGKNAFDLAEIEYYEYPLFDNKNQTGNIKMASFTINLGKKVKCPFYIGLKTNQAKSAYIRLYDSKVAMMVSLYGSFYDFFNSTKA